MDNYEILETIHKSKTGETIVFKVKEKNKKTCDKVYALKLIGELNNRFQKLIAFVNKKLSHLANKKVSQL